MGVFDKIKRLFSSKKVQKEEEIETYPCTVIQDRYRGAYSGGEWIALKEDYYRIPKDGPEGSDIPCSRFWENYSKPYGKGATPEEAVQDLRKQLKKEMSLTKDEIITKIQKGHLIGDYFSSRYFKIPVLLRNQVVTCISVEPEIPRISIEMVGIDNLIDGIQKGNQFFYEEQEDTRFDGDEISEWLEKLGYHEESIDNESTESITEGQD